MQDSQEVTMVVVQLDDGSIVKATAPLTDANGVSELSLTLNEPLNGRQVERIFGTPEQYERDALMARQSASARPGHRTPFAPLDGGELCSLASFMAEWLNSWGAWDCGPDDLTVFEPTFDQLLMWLSRLHLLGEPFEITRLWDDGNTEPHSRLRWRFDWPSCPVRVARRPLRSRATTGWRPRSL